MIYAYFCAVEMTIAENIWNSRKNLIIVERMFRLKKIIILEQIL